MTSGRFGLRSGALTLVALVTVGCGSPAAVSPTPAAAQTPAATQRPATAAPKTPAPYALGRFPAFPNKVLPASTAAKLQEVIDGAVERGIFAGMTAAVIVADRGSWVGAAGSSGGDPLTPASRRPTHSSAKTVTAAEILRLAEDGRLGLDDLASAYLPPELAFYDANGATIRQVLGMRSGIPDLNESDGFYPAEQAPTIEEVFRMLPAATSPPGLGVHYASTNYVLLGAVIEHVTGQPMAEAVRAGVLDRPGLAGVSYTVEDALAADGWGVETTAASWARWAYDLYGGSVISPGSLDAMADFGGQWYGLGTMDFSNVFGGLAVGHEGESSVTTCCSVIRLAAVTDEGITISVQTDTGSSISDRDYWQALDVLTKALRDAVRS